MSGVRPDMTDREVFGLVRDRLLAQGGPSRSPDRCLYRGDGGRRCALGHLISDAEYSPTIEGKALGWWASEDDGPVARALVASGCPNRASTRAMLARMQHMHDLFADDVRYRGELPGLLEEMAAHGSWHGDSWCP